MAKSRLLARKNEKTEQTQLLDDHLTRVSALCAKCAAAFASGEWGRLIGILHDIGKALAEFQRKLAGENIRVEHSGAGAALLWRQGVALRDMGVLLAAAIAGHHSGLPDHLHLKDRMKKNEKEKVLERIGEYSELKIPSDLQVPAWLEAARYGSDQKDQKRRLRAFELWGRFLFSALVDADRLDAERFDIEAESQAGFSARSYRGNYSSIPVLAEKLDVFIDRKMSQLSDEEKNRPLNRARAGYLNACRNAANEPRGAFSLSVPTGGGKTLSGMAFALRHAVAHDLRRVICVIPYTSIIEQNADVYRSVFGGENVLEHHCNFDPEKVREMEDEDVVSALEKAAENWDFPIIVTTTVQFFESLFAHGASKCRKLHNIARSVIVLDEAQTLPRDLLGTILEGLQELVDNYGCSVVLSTATQPAFKKRNDRDKGLREIREIVSEDAPKVPPRVTYHWPAKGEKLADWGELAEKALRYDRVLVVTHKRKDAAELAREFQSRGAEGLFHLSANMCPAHRFDVLKKIRECLKEPKHPVRLVATQLVEAGVDLDFQTVFRAMGGLDSIVQAAGRCNREGRQEMGDVYVYRFTTPPRGILSQACDVCEEMFDSAEKDGKELDLNSQETFAYFFRKLYMGAKPDRVPEARENFNYQTTDSRFKIIEDVGNKSLIVPYGEAARVVHVIETTGWTRALSRRLQQFTIQISSNVCEEIRKVLREFEKDVFVLERPYLKCYSETFGLLQPEEFRADVKELMA